MVDAVYIYIVDVQQQVTISFGQYVIDELRFRHLLAGRSVIGHVFNSQAPPGNLLDAPDSSGRITDCLFGKRDRHQVVQVTVIGTIAQVFAVTTDVVRIKELSYLVEECLVQGCRAAYIQGQSVTDDGHPVRYLAETAPEAAAHIDPVLRRHLHEVDP